VDMGRLGAAYAAHRATFWAAIAADYGTGVNPVVLEQAWRGGYAHSSTSSGGNGPTSIGSYHHQSQHQQSSNTPLTPVASPEGTTPSHCGGGDAYASFRGLGLNMGMMGMAMGGRQYGGEQYPKEDKSQQGGDKTRISSILGIDANPRSPKEREIVRRMEEGRGVVAASA
jgi:hypothetical protein